MKTVLSRLDSSRLSHRQNRASGRQFIPKSSIAILGLGLVLALTGMIFADGGGPLFVLTEILAIVLILSGLLIGLRKVAGHLIAALAGMGR